MSSLIDSFLHDETTLACRELRNVVAYRPTYFRAAEMLILRQLDADELISLEKTLLGD